MIRMIYCCCNRHGGSYNQSVFGRWWIGIVSLTVVAVAATFILVSAEPHSKPYIPFRTDPRYHPNFVKHQITWDDQRSNRRKSQVTAYNARAHEMSKDKQCPLHFTLGVSRRAHHQALNSEVFAIVKPPVIHPIFPARGPGRQLLHTTLYEHLDLLSPELAGGAAKASSIIKEGLIQHQEYPLLFESSSFAYSSPIIHDVNGDGIPDAILSDYDGGIYIIGLHQGKDGKRWFHKAQVPRIFVRKSWVDARVNETYKALHPEEAEQQQEVAKVEGDEAQTRDGNGDDMVGRDPYHSYFEYSYGTDSKNDILRGVTGNVLGQRREVIDALKDRRNRKKGPVAASDGGDSTQEEEDQEEIQSEGEESTERRRLLEVVEDEVASFPRHRMETASDEPDGDLQVTFPRRRLQEVDQQQEQQSQQQAEEQRRREEEAAEELRRREAQEREDRERQERERLEQEERERLQPQQEAEEQRLKDEQLATERMRQQEEARVAEDNRLAEEARVAEESRRAEEAKRVAEETEQQQQAFPQEIVQQASHENQQAVNIEDQPQANAAQADLQSQQMEGVEEAKQDVGIQEDKDQKVADFEAGEEMPDAMSRSGRSGSDDESETNESGDDEYPSNPDQDVHGDDMYRSGYDDYYGRYKSYRDDYYDEQHYVRINPHVLTTPALAEIPKLYGNEDEVEDILFVPVSYFLDEDEYEGHMNYRRFENSDGSDETEVQRGQFVASAIMMYQLGGDPRWGRQEHLDLSTDHSAPQNITLLGKIPVSQDNSRMGAFALSKPAVADIDGDGKMEVIIGTSMGIVYAFDATHMTLKNNWPIQMQYAVESPIVVEDVAANTKLEIFVADIGGNVAMFDEDANKGWHRDLLASVSDGPSSVRASSPMSLGDVDGDGVLDIAMSMQVLHHEGHKELIYIFAINAATGEDIANFPMSFDTPVSKRNKPDEEWIHEQLPSLLLVDLHSDQSHIQDYIRRNGTRWEPRNRKKSLPGGGTSPGLHIVFPLGETLYILEAASGCIQNFDVGEQMESMVQVDDVHGMNSLDLVVSTTQGNIITMESSSPYHPLNVWNNGESRGRLNNYAHGYSASQGIFVHSVSREYRDIFGVFVPVTFEIFDNRANIAHEPDKRVYKVEIRDGTSTKRAMWRNTYNTTGVYTERLYIPYGPGYYSLTVQMRTSNGLVYEDCFHLGYNVNYMDGFGIMLWLPLVLATITIFLGSSRSTQWDDDERDRIGTGQGILG